MRTIPFKWNLAAVILLLTVLCPAVRADDKPADNGIDPGKEKDIRHLMDLTGAGKTGVQVASRLIEQFRKQMPSVPQDFWDKFEKEMRPQDLVDLVVPIYAKHFTDDEIKALIQFYESPIGRKLVAEQPGIVQESMVAGQVWGQRLGAHVIQELREKGYLPQT